MRALASVTAAALICAAPALAAEQPRLGACSAVTDGFTLPGTDGCLRIGGFVRTEAAWTSAAQIYTLQMPVAPSPAPPSCLGQSAIGADARLTADLQLPTELGPLRAYVSLRGRTGAAAGARAR